MKRTITLLFASLLFFSARSSADESYTFPKREGKEIADDLKNLIQARLEDNRADILKYKTSLAEMVKKFEEKEKTGDLLKYPDAWSKIRECTIDDSNKVFKLKGMGFKPGTFTDYGQDPPKEYQYYISLPKEYNPQGDMRFPAIIFLHPEITKKGANLEREILNMLKDVYNDKALLDNYVIIAPIGPMEGSGRRKSLVDAAQDWESVNPGRVTAFLGIRLLLEQMVFDRTRVFLDGAGKAGLAAYKFATWYPSYFAGVIGRDAPLAPLAMENVKGISFLYISSSENGEKEAAAAEKWVKDQGGEGDPAPIVMIKDAGKLLEPSPENITEMQAWLGKLQKNTCPKEIYLKTADLATASAYWLMVNKLNAGLNIKLDDPEYPWVEAKVDPESNSIVLKSKNVLEMTLFLNDKIVDLDKKVTIILNGKNRFEGIVERSLDKMIDIFYDNLAGDFEIYCNFQKLTEEE